MSLGKVCCVRHDQLQQGGRVRKSPTAKWWVTGISTIGDIYIYICTSILFIYYTFRRDILLIDGINSANQLISSLSQYFHGFIHPGFHQHLFWGYNPLAKLLGQNHSASQHHLTRFYLVGFHIRETKCAATLAGIADRNGASTRFRPDDPDLGRWWKMSRCQESFWTTKGLCRLKTTGEFWIQELIYYISPLFWGS